MMLWLTPVTFELLYSFICGRSPPNLSWLFVVNTSNKIAAGCLCELIRIGVPGIPFPGIPFQHHGEDRSGNVQRVQTEPVQVSLPRMRRALLLPCLQQGAQGGKRHRGRGKLFPSLHWKTARRAASAERQQQQPTRYSKEAKRRQRRRRRKL